MRRRRVWGMTLEQVEPNCGAVVVAIDGGRCVSSHLNTLGLHVGDHLRVLDRAPFRGPVLVEVHGARVALGRGVALKIQVEVDGQRRPLVD